jgi:hypothetical protein
MSDIGDNLEPLISDLSDADDDDNSSSYSANGGSEKLPSTASAAASADQAISGRKSTPVYFLRKPDAKHEARFPFVTGSFDDDIINVVWASCNPQNIIDIFTCKMFGGGKGAQKHMGVWAREFIKFFATICKDESAICARIDSVLKDKRSALQCDDFEPVLQDILRQAKYFQPGRQWLIKHNRTNVLHVVSKTFFPSITDVQVAQCRSPHFCVWCIFFLPVCIQAISDTAMQSWCFDA